MREFLIGSVGHMWPYYLLALVVGEILLFVKMKKGIGFEIITALVVCIALTAIAQFQWHSAWAANKRPDLLAVVNFLNILMPITALVLANQYLARINKIILKQAVLCLVVLLTMFIWPIWALFVTCASGLDCL